MRVTVAEPEPEDSTGTVIQPGKPETAQGQEGPVWMLMAKVPPEAGPGNVVGETEYVQEEPVGVKTRMRLLNASAM
jgi:hypothetical protein